MELAWRGGAVPGDTARDGAAADRGVPNGAAPANTSLDGTSPAGAMSGGTVLDDTARDEVALDGTTPEGSARGGSASDGTACMGGAASNPVTNMPSPDGQAKAPAADLAGHLAALDWQAIAEHLNAEGYAVLGGLLAPAQCRALAAGYADTAQFRSRVVMARHGYGRGEYQYYAYPLPPLVAQLRTALYGPLARIANQWNHALGLAARYPGQHAAYLAQCHQAGQRRPTPLLLQYGAGDYNCLHQDLYGEQVFPLQVAVLLSAPGADFGGGEFVLTEQRPRMQSRVAVVALAQGDAVIFPVHQRPVQGTRGIYRVNMRHGVSRVRAGRRHTLGVIFHDAQ